MNFLSTVGEDCLIFFLDLIQKCGIDPKELSIKVGARLPVRTNNDDRYFNDNFQALPKHGYTKMVEKMLEHENIQISLNTSFLRGLEKKYFHSFLSIPIDEYYNFNFGELPYRSILFKKILEKGNDQKVPVINFTDASHYTRKTQWNLFPNSYNFKGNIKTTTYEMPCSMDINRENIIIQ